MALVKRKKGANLANVPIKFKPYKTQLTEIDRLGTAWEKDRPDVVRELIEEALKARRLKQIGKDEATEAVVEAQKKAMTEVLAPVREQLAGLTTTVERFEARMIDEFEHASGRLKFVILALRFIVVEVMIGRVLLRDYVHTAYKVFVEKVGKPTHEIEANFAKRVETYRGEAEQALDRITEEGVGGLHEMAGRGDVFAGSPAQGGAGAERRRPGKTP